MIHQINIDLCIMASTKNRQEKKCKKRKYHVQKDEDVAHKYVKMFCNTNQFSVLPFCGPHMKPHGVCRLNNHYHMCLDTKLCHRTCAIYLIPCTCTQCTHVLDKPYTPGVPPHQQPRYQPIRYFTNWPVLGSYNNWNFIQF